MSTNLHESTPCAIDERAHHADRLWIRAERELHPAPSVTAPRESAIVHFMVGMLESRTRAAFSKRARERSRVAAHIARAEALARESAPPLDPLRALVRALLLDSLREYREDGRFPQNVHRPCNTPVFVDERGTLCAVGHLLALTGEQALVDKIHAERNLATVHQLSDEPALAAWLDATGLSLAEAERIQPSYSSCTSGVQCFCSPFSLPRLPYLVNEGATHAVLDCTVIGANVARVDRIYGSTTGHAVGDELAIRALRGEPGPRVLIAVGPGGGQDPPTFGQDGGAMQYVAIPVAADGYASCVEVSGRVARARAGNVIDALTSNQCVASLSATEPAIAQQTCTRAGGCGCVVAGHAERPAPQATLSILLALVGAITARRARAARRIAKR
jgi:hypothetical protein